MKATIDRIEDGKAIILLREDEKVRFTLPASILPDDCCEGDIINIEITKDEESTEETKKRVSRLIEKLKKKKYGFCDGK
jgi:hypothetical protein